MFRDRTVKTTVLALVGLIAFAAMRPASPDPVDDARASENRFFVNKTHQTARYDAIIVGDSRALRGISPAVVGSDLGVSRIYNFAFSACGLDRRFYTEAEKLLDPAAPAPFVVLAPTALSFQPWKRVNAQYHEYKNRPRDQVWVYRNLPELAMWFQPVSPSIYVRKALHILPARRLEQVFHADGWIETRQSPFDDMSDLTLHRQRMTGHTIDDTMIEDMMVQTREWTQRGIRVFAFYHPAQSARTIMEDSILGFDRRKFAESFTGAGGTWLDIKDDGLQTYDGSHLVAESAVRMSHELATMIRHNW